MIRCTAGLSDKLISVTDGTLWRFWSCSSLSFRPLYFRIQDDTSQAVPSPSGALKLRAGRETREAAHFFPFTHFVLPVSRTHRLERIHSAGYSRSSLLDMQIYSSSVKVVKQPGLATSRVIPAFGDQDRIEGNVILDPSCSQNGRLTISVCFCLPSILLSAERGLAGRSLRIFVYQGQCRRRVSS